MKKQILKIAAIALLGLSTLSCTKSPSTVVKLNALDSLTGQWYGVPGYSSTPRLFINGGYPIDTTDRWFINIDITTLPDDTVHYQFENDKLLTITRDGWNYASESWVYDSSLYVRH